MISLYRFATAVYSCTYHPERSARMEYEIVASMTAAEYQARMLQGWRRFGFSMFHPQCPHCQACRSLRVPVERFAPNRSQRRAWKANEDLTLVVGEPEATREKLDLYDRFHSHQSEAVGWNETGPKDFDSYIESFVHHPFPTEEWRYYLGDRLVGVGYVDVLPEAMSAIYFYHEPELFKRSLGTFNILSILAVARQRKIPHVYLGYYVEGCRSLEYKGKFQPNQVVDAHGQWHDFFVG